MDVDVAMVDDVDTPAVCDRRYSSSSSLARGLSIGVG